MNWSLNRSRWVWKLLEGFGLPLDPIEMLLKGQPYTLLGPSRTRLYFGEEGFPSQIFFLLMGRAGLKGVCVCVWCVHTCTQLKVGVCSSSREQHK